MCFRMRRHASGSATQMRARPTKTCMTARKVPIAPGSLRQRKRKQNQTASQNAAKGSPVGNRFNNLERDCDRAGLLGFCIRCRLLRVSLPRELQGIACCRKMSSGEQQQTGEKRPHHQAYRNIKRTIDRLKVEPREGLNIEDLRKLPEQTDDNCRGQNGSRRDLSIGQYPVDQEEEQNTCETGAEAQE